MNLLDPINPVATVEAMDATDKAADPEIKARYELHKIKRIKAGKPPLNFADWLDFYLSGRKGGIASQCTPNTRARRKRAKAVAA